MSSILPARTLHIYAILSLLLFMIFELLKYHEFTVHNLITNYLNDFLVLPMVATLCLRAVWLIKNDKNIRLKGWSVFSLVAMYSFYFEYYLPQHAARYTSDVWDIVCYMCGGILFYVLQKAP